MASRSRSCWAISFTFSRPEPGDDGANGRSAESTSGSALHNAPGTLQPARHLVGAGFLPSIRHWRQPSLLSLALEAKPAVAVLACDGNRSPERSAPPIGGPTAVQFPDIRTLRGRARRGPAIDLSSLGCGRRDHPHFPPSARRVEKRPITHRQFLRSRMARQGLCSPFHLAGRVPISTVAQAGSHSISETSVYVWRKARPAYRASSFFPVSR